MILLPLVVLEAPPFSAIGLVILPIYVLGNEITSPQELRLLDLSPVSHLVEYHLRLGLAFQDLL